METSEDTWFEPKAIQRLHDTNFSATARKYAARIDSFHSERSFETDFEHIPSTITKKSQCRNICKLQQSNQQLITTSQ